MKDTLKCLLLLGVLSTPIVGVGSILWKASVDHQKAMIDVEISQKIARDKCPYQFEVGALVRPTGMKPELKGVITHRRKSKFYDFDWGTVGEYRVAYRNVYSVSWFTLTWESSQKSDGKMTDPELKPSREQEDYLEVELTKVED